MDWFRTRTALVAMLATLAIIGGGGQAALAKNCETCPIPCNTPGCRG